MFDRFENQPKLIKCLTCLPTNAIVRLAPQCIRDRVVCLNSFLMYEKKRVTIARTRKHEVNMANGKL